MRNLLTAAARAGRHLKFIEGRFARRLATLSGGTVLGQAVLVACSPLLTRLYTPAEFGVLAVFIAASSMLLNVMTLRYEYAIPSCRTDDEAAGMVALCAMVTLLVSAALALTLPLVQDSLVDYLAMPDLRGLLWLLPAMMLVWGLTLPLGGWSIRNGTFRRNAVGNFAQFASQGIAPLALGVAFGGSGSLVLGYAMGPLARLAGFLVAPPRPSSLRWRRIEFARLCGLARRFWRYPVFSGSSALLQNASQMLPSILIAILYGPAAAGIFGLAQRIMGLPLRMLADAASSVFLAEIARADRRVTHQLFIRTSTTFLCVGVAGMLPVMLFGPQLFALVFGESWRATGEITQILVPLYLARFVVTPVSQILNVYRQQHMHFLSSILNCLMLALSFWAGWHFMLSLHSTVLLYALGSTASFMLYFVSAWYAATARPAGAGMTDGSFGPDHSP